jgi:hypothetical protein
MAIFRFTIYDKHEKQIFVNGRQRIRLLDETDESWPKFSFFMDTDYIRVDAFREYILFDSAKNPIECTKVFLSDGSYVYAVVKPETFAKNYTEHLKGGEPSA